MHGFQHKSWSGSAVSALDCNSSCSKPAGPWEHCILIKCTRKLCDRTKPVPSVLQFNVITTRVEREIIYCMAPTWIQQLVSPILSDCCFTYPDLHKKPFQIKTPGCLQFDARLISTRSGGALQLKVAGGRVLTLGQVQVLMGG